MQMAGQQAVAESLYRRPGGHEPLAAVVDVFYRSILADAELAPFFAGADMERLRHHQAAFLGAALGGPRTYAGRRIREAHRGLGITAHHFGLIAGYLDSALATCGVSLALRGEVLGHVAALRDEVVEREV